MGLKVASLAEKKGQIEHPELIANRYRVQKVLGRGGMAVVYQVHDTSTDRDIALKRLTVEYNSSKQKKIVELFEREFHTLSHLSHPRVVEVYDYGKDDGAAYYTMELLDGGDLSQLSPLPWATACALLCDVCSALSLLHSRRLVHRDLTPRNIRCSQANTAKLIDFGAMLPVGPCKHMVGTPTYVAPEVFSGQVVDARTDLFSLGATAYRALTGRHAYPAARTFAALPDAWRTLPSPPSTHVPEIPKELDQLVMSLLSLRPTARPVSAAEVMERLSAIAGLHIDEQLLVRQAYLSTPTLVGRDALLLRVRKQVVRALRGRGGTVMITGASGLGRSRFLDACVLEGKLTGALVLRADAADASRGNWGAAQAIARQLLDTGQETVLEAARPHAPVLGHILPELLDRLDGVSLKTVDGSQELRAQVQAALCDWLLEVSKHRCLVLAIDDVHRIDEPSAAFVALLSDHAPMQRMMAAVTVETDAPATSEGALSLLSKAAGKFKLQRLGPQDTERLLGSVFGDVPNVRLLADRLHAISGGNPRAVMQLAQHLLDKGLVSYQAGAWTLPSSIDAGDLPRTVGDTLKMRVCSLSASALELAQTMALCSKQSLSFDECLALTVHGNKAELVRDLDQLFASEILSTDGDCYALSQATWTVALTDGLARERAQALHLRLAQLLGKRALDQFLAAQHLLQAGEPERALDVLVEHIHAVRDGYMHDQQAILEYIQSLPEDWISTSESLLEVCRQLGRPRRDGVSVQGHLVACAAVTAQPQKTHLNQILDQLYRDTGLDLYEQQDDSADASTRLLRALELAQKRFDATPESERVLPPAEAIALLATVIIQAIGGVGGTHDYAFFESLLSLEPLVPLSPALGIVEKNRQSVAHIQAGRLEQSRRGYLEIIDRVAQPDRAGLDPAHHRYMRLGALYAVGVIDVSLGLRSAVSWIDKIEQDPLFEVNAWRLRMLFALRQGDFQKADHCKKRVELLQIQNSPTQLFEGTHLWMEILCYAEADDLVRVKQTMTGIEKMAERYPGWVPCLHFARGTYQRLRGDYTSALSEFERAMKLTAPGRHVSWATVAGATVAMLSEVGHLGQAKALGDEASEAAEREGLDHLTRHIRQPLALVEATLKQFEAAIRLSENVVHALQAMGTTGVLLGTAYETRARVAIMMKDGESFATYARLCAKQYRAGHNPALTAKYERLVQEARQAALIVSPDVARAADLDEQTARGASSVATALGACKEPMERAERALAMIVKQSGCLGGLLYALQKDGPVLTAQVGDRRPPAEIDSLVTSHLSAELEDADEVTVTTADKAEGPPIERAWNGLDGEKFVPVLLAHEAETGYAITGVVVLCVDPSEKFNIPFRLLPVLSRSLRETGDVITAVAAGVPGEITAEE